MDGRRLVGAVLAALVLATPASAHNLSLTPRAGDLGTFYRFTGRAWQPTGRVFWEYFATTRASTPTKSGDFLAGRNGRFRFTWTDGRPGLTHRMCFTQFDTRFARVAGTSPGRRFRQCTNFWVAAPSAYYDPAAGVPGNSFVLLALGFPPGRTLQGVVRGPDGPTQVGNSFTLTARTRGGFSPPGPFGPVFVPRGGAIATSTATDTGAGLYIAEIREPLSGLVAYAGVRLTR
jgi:hypothetical protein